MIYSPDSLSNELKNLENATLDVLKEKEITTSVIKPQATNNLAHFRTLLKEILKTRPPTEVIDLTLDEDILPPTAPKPVETKTAIRCSVCLSHETSTNSFCQLHCLFVWAKKDRDSDCTKPHCADW